MSADKTITLIGFGNQAKAWALNLRDSGMQVKIALRKTSKQRALVESLKLTVVELEDVTAWNSAWIAVLIPDDQIANFTTDYAPKCSGSTWLYAHGWALDRHELHKKFPQVYHALLAPKAIGSELRFRYETKDALGGVYSVEHVPADKKSDIEQGILKIAKDLGLTVGPYATSIKDETLADLFSEQSLLCSVIPYTCLETYNMLRSQGVGAELAYFEVWHEVQLIVKAMVNAGPAAFFDMISPNALIGAHKGQQVLLNENYKAGLQKLLADIQSGAFDKEVASTDLKELRRQMKSFWQKQEMDTTITRLNTLMKEGRK